MSRNGEPALFHSSTNDGTRDLYDHAINLVDTTLTPGEHRPIVSSSGSWRELARYGTRTSVKEQLARRKYAKWKQEKSDSKDGPTVTVNGAGEEEDDVPRSGQPVAAAHPSGDAYDFAHVPPDSSVKPKGVQQSSRHHRHEKESEVDILYENQRGSFFCGIPLYSHSSLLNFDPSPWVTREFRDSAVNITNAQVPDPSWAWAWKTWYVDMSYDVDEEGWQYSFAFGRSFSWHGSHPWFHSFVRRRRWLRKRVKRSNLALSKPESSTMSAAHRLNNDYFTIHSKRDRSPGSAMDAENSAVRPASYLSARSLEGYNEPPEEINNIASLLKALRLATVDRAKIDVVKQFVERGGEELHYLKEEIPTIMDFLVFQNSRRQLLGYLKKAADDARSHRDQHATENRPEGEEEGRRIDNLLSAVDAANEEIKGLEYWSDRKHILQTTDDAGKGKEGLYADAFDKPGRDPSIQDDPVEDILGIPESAEIDESPSLGPRDSSANKSMEDEGAEKEGKDTKEEGKNMKEDDSERPGSDHKKVTTRRLGNDAVLVPDSN